MIRLRNWTATLLSCWIAVTLAQDLTARIDHLTAHQELGEGEAAHLQCLVTLSQPDAVDVIWQRRVISGPKKVLEEKLARNGKPEPDMGRVSATVRPHRGGDQRQLEYSLLVKDLMKNSDEGMYDCQLAYKNGSLIAARHSLVAIMPQHSTEPIVRAQHMARSDSSISVDTYDYSDVDDERDDKSPRRVLNEDELGPVTARFVIVRRGMDVVLECHDAVGNEDVTWEKQGEISTVGHGKELRLFRVDRWDSGLYFCSTNATRKGKHQVTLRVDTPPKVSLPGAQTQVTSDRGERKVINKIEATLGQSAILRCKAEATPVPQISWYMEIAETTTSLPSPISEHRSRNVETTSSNPDHAKKLKKFRLLHSGEEFGISIDAYKDGMMETSLHVRHVDRRHFGNFLCHAKNQLGEDQQLMALVEAPLIRIHSGAASMSTMTSALFAAFAFVAFFEALQFSFLV